MAVEVDHAHGAVGAVDGPQQGEGDGVVTSERDDPGQGLALLGRADLLGVGRRLAGQDVVMALLDLVKSPGVVVPVYVAYSVSSPAEFPVGGGGGGGRRTR